MSQTTTPSGAKLNICAVMVRDATNAEKYRIANQHAFPSVDRLKCRSESDQARTAVVALLARNAELEEVNENYSVVCARHLDRAINAEIERDALAADNLALREALIDVRDNVRGDSPEMWTLVDDAIALGKVRSDG